MMTRFRKTFEFSCTDNRKKECKELLINIQQLMRNMEPVKRNGDILIINSDTGHMLSKKLFKLVEKYQLMNKKCYIYSKFSNSVREIINLEESLPELNYPIYGVSTHSGMILRQYKSITETIDTETIY